MQRALVFLALLATAAAFLVPRAPVSAGKSLALPKAAVLPGVAASFAAAPAFADDALVQLPSMPLALDVTFGAYLAVLLGTFIPTAFLIVLYLQSESRKAGERSGPSE
eukprot:CAMPEP_0198419162 /NCGR_PEP_ID=MMETSP1452-20131203/23_1 /TAXON_ID=1181717 /ORGANISM="Synchroma pusillum, Strain CCMP3072" /LENGTH=107 /DNA_ID=CAMNT_0044139285 /DNA_START=44 /DNA_END=367 /DNA_ORIENTATION=-